jgi:hypothetical protein
MKLLFPLLFLGTLLATTSLNAQDSDFFDKADQFFETYAQYNAVQYRALYQQPIALESLVEQIETTSINDWSEAAQKAFYINAYNLLVIATVVEHYPIASPNEIVDFWDGINHQVAGKMYTLEQLEAFVVAAYKDPSVHFALVNGSVACPPIANFAYQPQKLEAQLKDRVISTLNNSQYIQYNPELKRIELPMLFNRYETSFQPNVVAYLNQYRVEKVTPEVRIAYKNEDWSLNSYQETPSKLRKKKPKKAVELSKKVATGAYAGLAQVITLPKGVAELQDFNNIYTVGVGTKENGTRSSYFNSYFTAFYGATGKLDLGMCLLYRASRERDYFTASPFKTLNLEQSGSGQLDDAPADIRADHGLSHMGFQVRFAPFKNISLSFEHGFMLPIKGVPNENSVDENIYSVTQVYYMQNIAPKTQLFLALTFWQGFQIGKPFRIQLPLVRGFVNYFATPRLCLYVNSMYLLEWGVGVKYLLTPKFEVQVMYSYFIPVPGLYDLLVPGAASVMTYNLGFRYRL